MVFAFLAIAPLLGPVPPTPSFVLLPGVERPVVAIQKVDFPTYEELGLPSHGEIVADIEKATAFAMRTAKNG